MQSWALQKLHSSWLIAVWCMGVVIGVISVMKMPYGVFSGVQWLLAGVVLALPVFWKKYAWMVVLIIISGFFVGLWRGSSGQVGLDSYQMIIGQQVTLMGRVLEDPDIDKKDQTVLRLSDISVNKHSLPGNVWVVTAKNDQIKRSDVVTVQAKMSDGFGAFAATMYRAKIMEIKRPTPGDVAVGVRDEFAKSVREHVPESQSALGLGFLLGLRRALPPDLSEYLKIAGLTHVVVASGYNLTILVRLSRRLFVRISKYLAILSSSAMILAFMAVTGLSPSMSRAGLVAGLSLAAWYYGRTVHPLVLLPFAAAVTLFINPQFGWNDLGWQLSFAAFAGVIILAPLMQRYFFGEKEPGTIRQILGETISAQIFTMPLLVVAFGVISNVAIIANLLILPFVPLAMLLTFLTGILSGVPAIGEIIAAPTTWLLDYMLAVAEWLATQRWAQTEIKLEWCHAVLAYLFLVIWMWWMKRKTNFSLRKVNIIE